MTSAFELGKFYGRVEGIHKVQTVRMVRRRPFGWPLLLVVAWGVYGTFCIVTLFDVRAYHVLYQALTQKRFMFVILEANTGRQEGVKTELMKAIAETQKALDSF